MRAFNLRKDLARRQRRYPEAWRLGESFAMDRFYLLPGEDRRWDQPLGNYLSEFSGDAVQVIRAVTTRQGRTLETEFLSTLDIVCSFTILPLLRRYVDRGLAQADQQGNAEFRSDYDEGRKAAELVFFGEPDPWLASAPLVAYGISLVMHRLGLAYAFTTNGFAKPYRDADVAKRAFMARMGELVRYYIAPEHESALRARAGKAASERQAVREARPMVEVPRGDSTGWTYYGAPTYALVRVEDDDDPDSRVERWDKTSRAWVPSRAWSNTFDFETRRLSERELSLFGVTAD